MLLPYPFAGPFDYRVPPDLHPQPGDIVLVPLNRREEVALDDGLGAWVRWRPQQYLGLNDMAYANGGWIPVTVA